MFIDQAITGEKIKIRILKVASSFAYGKIIDIIEKSPYRKCEDCFTYTRCGGCDLRHIAYEKTLEIKKDIVQNCLQKELKKSIGVENTIGMKTPIHYRNKLQYPVGITAEGKPIMGVYAKRTHDIIPMKNACLIQDVECSSIAEDIYKFIVENKISAYNEKTLKGVLRHIIIRIGIKTNEIMVILVINSAFEKSKEDKLVKELTEKYPKIKTIVKNYNTKKTNVILGEKTKTVYGDGYIYDILGDFKFRISPLSFYQVNPLQTEVLYSKAIEFANLSGTETIFDLYCGIGTIGIFASKNVKKVYGIELIENAIKDAKQNAKENEIENAEFIVGEVESILPKLVEEEKIEADVVFLDPPRKGSDKLTLETLKQVKPKKIIYISCNPATLARDINFLEDTYSIEKVQPVDLFPFTNHVECCALLEVRNG